MSALASVIRHKIPFPNAKLLLVMMANAADMDFKVKWDPKFGSESGMTEAQVRGALDYLLANFYISAVGRPKGDWIPDFYILQ